jgi:hypothetical protein
VLHEDTSAHSKSGNAYQVKSRRAETVGFWSAHGFESVMFRVRACVAALDRSVPT